MDYRELPAPPGLGLACVWSQTVPRDAEPYVQRVVPDACVDLIWSEHDGEIHVAGPDTGPVLADIPAGGRLVGVRFRPGLAGPALGVPLEALRDGRASLRDLWGDDAEVLTDAVAASADPATELARTVATRLRTATPADPAASALVTAFTPLTVESAQSDGGALLTGTSPGTPSGTSPGAASGPASPRSAERPSPHDAEFARAVRSDADAARARAMTAPDAVSARPDPAPAEEVSVREVAVRLGLSERQLRRRSLAAFGYGPKTLQRILRFQRALELARRGTPPAEVAYAMGYSDQAHFAHEVRDLAGVTLTELLGPAESAAATTQR